MTPAEQQEGFSRRYVDALRRAGNTAVWAYDPHGFALQSDAHGLVFLASAYQDWQQAPFWRRGSVLRAYVTALAATTTTLPSTYEEARPHLMLRIRDLAGLENLTLQLTGNRRTCFSYQRLNDDLAIELVYDTPLAIQSVNQDTLSRWGVSLDEALRSARYNLRLATEGTFTSIAPGVFAARWSDSYDSTRMLLTELIARLDLAGDPVVLAPHRDRLFVTGSDDEAGLGTIARLATDSLEQHRRLSGVAFRYLRGEWARWMPPVGHPNEAAFRLLARTTAAMDYEEQKQLLTQRYERDASDVFVASVLLLRDTRGTVRTLTTWADGVTALLPRADSVAFGRVGGPRHLEFPWSVVEDVMGGALQPQGRTPERYLVERYPTDDEMARMSAAAPQ